MKAWVFQDPNMLKKHGAEKASWLVGYYGPDGRRKSKSCGRGSLGKKTAKALADRIHSQLTIGTYEETNRTLWADFRKAFEADIAGLSAASQVAVKVSLNHFEAICKPVKMAAITSHTIAQFIAARRTQRGKKPDSTVRPASVAKDVRYLKLALRKAAEWKYLATVPKFDRIKIPEKLPTFISAEEFGKLYHAVDVAKWPSVPNVSTADWWRVLLVFCFTTGWRIGQILALRWADVDLEGGAAVSRADDNKGRRDQRITLAAVTIEHLRKLQGTFNELVFPWDRTERGLWVQFGRIQEAAGVKPDAKDAFGFHDLRRGFATLNASLLTPLELQAVMQHRSFETTKLYINAAHKLNAAGSKVFVPDLTPKAETG